MKWTALDELVRRVTCFADFDDMIADWRSAWAVALQCGSYFPSFYGAQGRILANAYDFAMRTRGDSRRAFRGDFR